MNFVKAMCEMLSGKICRCDQCLYQIHDNRLMVQITQRQGWTICSVNVTALMSKEWHLHAREEFYEKKIVVRAGCYYVEVDLHNHMTLMQCAECASFAGFVYELPKKRVISNAPMLFKNRDSYCGAYTDGVEDTERTVLRPVAARFRSE